MKKIVLILAIIGILFSSIYNFVFKFRWNRKILFLAFGVLLKFMLISCKKDKGLSNTELIGNWKLIEVLMDPGDGSGTFSSVESDKIITFKNNGIITSNGRLCDMSINSDNPTSGTYSITEMTFNSSDCSDPDYNYMFEKNENILIINYPCIEPCKTKYQKQ